MELTQEFRNGVDESFRNLVDALSRVLAGDKSKKAFQDVEKRASEAHAFTQMLLFKDFGVKPIPVHFSSSAAAEHIAQLGLEREFEQMIEHAKQTVPGTRKIEVMLEGWPEDPSDLRIVIMPHRPHPGGDDPAHREWIAWLVDTFPPEVCQHFTMSSLYTNRKITKGLRKSHKNN
jgi:hypothetical protein